MEDFQTTHHFEYKIKLEIQQMFYANLIYPDNIYMPPHACTERHYDSELDNIISLIYDMCNAISICDGVRFEVSGFGQDVWPVDVTVDLVLVVEQLPKLLQWLDTQSDEIGQLDFFEQGVERLLTFRRVDAAIVISCRSRTTWQPMPGEETISHVYLDHMLTRLTVIFLALAKRLCPTIYVHPWFEQWRQQEVIRRRLDGIDI